MFLTKRVYIDNSTLQIPILVISGHLQKTSLLPLPAPHHPTPPTSLQLTSPHSPQSHDAPLSSAAPIPSPALDRSHRLSFSFFTASVGTDSACPGGIREAQHLCSTLPWRRVSKPGGHPLARTLQVCPGSLDIADSKLTDFVPSS